ncbi:hypothetical protein QQ73_02320, partial [Candidatus Endoriftia persephone str. Guaymas]|nr:hypothetical protein [Candidatus Endoriftia persephone str. Guaymas]
THLLCNNKQKAIDVLMSWKKQHPDDAKGELGLASIYQSSGDNVKAQAMYEEVLQIEQAIRVLKRALNSAALFPEREIALKLKQRLMWQWEQWVASF